MSDEAVTPYAAVRAVAGYLYWTAPHDLAELLFPGRHPEYLKEWTERFKLGFPAAVAHMDRATFKRFVDLAIENARQNGSL